MSKRFVALYTVGVDIRADDELSAKAVARDFMRNIDIVGGVKVEVQDDTFTVCLDQCYDPEVNHA